MLQHLSKLWIHEPISESLPSAAQAITSRLGLREETWCFCSIPNGSPAFLFFRLIHFISFSFFAQQIGCHRGGYQLHATPTTMLHSPSSYTQPSTINYPPSPPTGPGDVQRVIQYQEPPTAPGLAVCRSERALSSRWVAGSCHLPKRRC